MSSGITRYAEHVRLAMQTANNPTKVPLSLRQIAGLTGYSYEHHRKVVNGEPVGSRVFNDVLCKALGLDADYMWELAQVEKVQRRLGTGFLTKLPKDKRLVELWKMLTDSDRDKVIKIAEGFALATAVPSQNATKSAHPQLEQAVSADATPSGAAGGGATASSEVAAGNTKSSPKGHKKAKLAGGAPQVQYAGSPWMNLEQLRQYLSLPTAHAAYNWVRNYHMPKAKGAVRVHRENVHRVLAGLPPLPLTAFLEK